MAGQGWSTPARAAEKRLPMKIEGKQSLPLRVLSRAFSTIYKSANTEGGTVMENVPAFQTFFVYQKKGGQSDLDTRIWYEVGSDNRGTVLGWMSSDDVFEWKQTMCLSYTHPEGRYPVLMFDHRTELEKLTAMDPEARQAAVEEYYLNIAMGDLPSDFPIVTVEPKKAIDITKEFYLLPILQFEEIELDNREARLLKLAAVTGEEADARISSDIRKNKEYLHKAVQEKNAVDAKTLDKLAVDIVWVMDTTNSMMPYINQTMKVVQDASKKISANADLAKAVRFGIWGYRDSVEIPDIGYNVNNYTPALQNIEQFMTTLKSVDVTKVGSQGYAEDVYAGVNGAVDKTSWTPNALRFVILVGDAPAHELGHKWNSSGQGAATLRNLANDRNITLLTIHIKDPDPRAEEYHYTAEDQFMTLSTNRGVAGEPAYFATSSENLAGFEEMTKMVTGSIIDLLEKVRQEKEKMVAAAQAPVKTAPPAQLTVSTKAPVSDFDVPEQSAGDAGKLNLELFAEGQEAGEGTEEDGQRENQSKTDAALKAAFVQWIGSQTGAQAPRDVVAWVTDKDLLTTDIQALEVRLLINKQQLDSLRETLKTILAAGRKGQISGEDFFSSLQAAAATTARDPEMIKRAKSLAQSGLVPEFLVGLPYTSRIMDMNNELWSSWSVDEQDMFLADLEARIMAYETIHDGPEGWVQLNKSDEPGDFVYPISLELLP
ncbi:VWA domain-containing protein [Desulfobulbus rhabdoformis]|nr:VWA domain-containing protein [Desulfobulbus rhabdoformis]